jgi:hypothetical protein
MRYAYCALRAVHDPLTFLGGATVSGRARTRVLALQHRALRLLSFWLRCSVTGHASAVFPRIQYVRQSEILAVRPQASMRDRFELLQNLGLLARTAAIAFASHPTF